ncbi:MAG: cysteine--tRNA ligase [Ignavibacteria bacterium]|nr:cysteine--tRNA ligase [Ignavibacteria bacterium]
MLKLFNSLTRTLEEFVPIEPGKVRMYCCGPTVYNFQHIGNFRTFVFEDILLRTLKYNGFDVKYIMNITDVGHLTSDEDTGEDKVEKSAKEQGRSVWDVTKFYTEVFLRDVELLNITPPEMYTKATEYMNEQIAMVKCLEDRGFTYRTSDGIYFDTAKFPDYPKLARLDIEGMKEGARIEFSEEKRSITDFALWKFSPKDEKRQMEWDSPWGVGFPGWHIECSAMSTALLGNHFDIHCGGIDHLPVHHTNELAQSEACTGEKYVNYWLHGEFLNMGDEKMAKSTGNFITLQTLIDKGYSPMDYRYFLLMAHYRKKLKFSFEALDSAKSGYRNLLSKINTLRKPKQDSASDKQVYEEMKSKFLNAVNEDMNMPVAMSVLWEAVRNEKLSAEDRLKLAFDFDRVLGLRLDQALPEQVESAPDEVVRMADERLEAKRAKDFARADKLRQEIKDLGFEVLDSKDGYTLRKSD